MIFCTAEVSNGFLRTGSIRNFALFAGLLDRVENG